MPNNYCFALFILLWENQLSSLGHISIKNNFTWPWLKVCGSWFNSVALMKYWHNRCFHPKTSYSTCTIKNTQTSWLLPWEIQEVFINCVYLRESSFLLNSNRWHLCKFQEIAINLTFSHQLMMYIPSTKRNCTLKQTESTKRKTL